MKRVFVRSRFRSAGIGRTLANALIASAGAAGYERMCLDTTTYFTPAIALYESLGFHRCPAYYEIPDSLRAITGLPPVRMTAPG
jgi:ribosomal protein S18 acetylase RimI-like enzyme